MEEQAARKPHRFTAFNEPLATDIKNAIDETVPARVRLENDHFEVEFVEDDGFDVDALTIQPKHLETSVEAFMSADGQNQTRKCRFYSPREP
jgi:hypothetical protein